LDHPGFVGKGTFFHSNIFISFKLDEVLYFIHWYSVHFNDYKGGSLSTPALFNSGLNARSSFFGYQFFRLRNQLKLRDQFLSGLRALDSVVRKQQIEMLSSLQIHALIFHCLSLNRAFTVG